MSDQLRNIVENIAPERKRRFEYAEQIGAYLYSILDRKNMSQKDLAEKMGMKPPQLNRYMNGEANLNLETISRIELALGEQILSIKKPRKAKGGRTLTVEVEERSRDREKPFKLYNIQGSRNVGRRISGQKNLSASVDSDEKVNGFA